MVALFVVICLNDLVAWIRRKYQERAERRRIAAEERAARLAKEEAPHTKTSVNQKFRQPGTTFTSVIGYTGSTAYRCIIDN